MLPVDIMEKLSEFELVWQLVDDCWYIDGLNIHPSAIESLIELLEINERLHNT